AQDSTRSNVCKYHRNYCDNIDRDGNHHCRYRTSPLGTGRIRQSAQRSCSNAQGQQQKKHGVKPAMDPIPQGYRQGLITAITVVLGFSLTFFRFWGFEASGEWTTRSIIATVPLAVAVLLGPIQRSIFPRQRIAGRF